MNYEIVESYDGRLPEYQVIDGSGKLIKIFDTVEEAEKYIKTL